MRKVDWGALTAVLRHVRVAYVALAVLLYLPFIGGLALRWKMFLGKQQMTLPLSRTLSLTWAGQFFNSFLPGSTGGDLVKIYQLCRFAPERKATAAATVIADRVIALLALVTLAAAALLLDPAPLRLLSGVTLPIKAVVTGLVVIGLIGWVLLRLTDMAGWVVRFLRVVRASGEALALDARLIAAFTLAVIVHLLNFTIVYLLAQALGLSLTYLQMMLIMPVVLFFLLLPLTINGHGLREVLLVGYFSYFHVQAVGQPAAQPNDLAIALSLLMVANDLVCSLPGGIWYFSKIGRVATTRTETAVAESAL